MSDDERERAGTLPEAVPEADVLEQTEELENDEDEEPTDLDELPEADALEQARSVPLDDEDRR
jgi:hypothetical protein